MSKLIFKLVSTSKESSVVFNINNNKIHMGSHVDDTSTVGVYVNNHVIAIMPESLEHRDEVVDKHLYFNDITQRIVMGENLGKYVKHTHRVVKVCDGMIHDSKYNRMLIKARMEIISPSAVETFVRNFNDN